ncbi:uncharacterized protein LOC141908695 [Tubulanus polymorphus]|uniref:uncharacterized protein LOC141908695 n=1 Tax=Tubulanus polymorphus TaxID=672921 RepID=UPI003DA46997
MPKIRKNCVKPRNLGLAKRKGDGELILTCSPGESLGDTKSKTPSQMLIINHDSNLDQAEFNIYSMDESGQVIPTMDINSDELGANINMSGSFDASKHYSCLECGKSFASDISLRTHIRLHRQPQVCETCSESFPTKHGLEHHIQIAHQKKHVWTCQECGASFVDRVNLRAHRDDVHAETYKPYECNLCDERFGHMVSLITHMRDHTGKKTLFQCWHCPQEFNDVGRMVLHMKRHFNCDDVFDCDRCEQSFDSKQRLDNHVKIHNGVKPFKCGVCEDLFETLAEYRSHSQDHCKCKGCHRVFKTPNSARNHMKSCLRLKMAAGNDYYENASTADDDVWKFMCGGCNAKFCTEEYLQAHMLACVKNRRSDDEMLTTPTTIDDVVNEEILATQSRKIGEGIVADDDGLSKRELAIIDDVVKKIDSSVEKYKNGIFYKCSYCNKNLTTFDQMMKHLMTLHQYIPLRVCCNCKRSFANKQAIDLHMHLECLSSSSAAKTISLPISKQATK